MDPSLSSSLLAKLSHVLSYITAMATKVDEVVSCVLLQRKIWRRINSTFFVSFLFLLEKGCFDRKFISYIVYVQHWFGTTSTEISPSFSTNDVFFQGRNRNFHCSNHYQGVSSSGDDEKKWQGKNWRREIYCRFLFFFFFFPQKSGTGFQVKLQL